MKRKKGGISKMEKRISEKDIRLISKSLMALQFMKHYNYKEKLPNKNLNNLTAY